MLSISLKKRIQQWFQVKPVNVCQQISKTEQMDQQSWKQVASFYTFYSYLYFTRLTFANCFTKWNDFSRNQIESIYFLSSFIW